MGTGLRRWFAVGIALALIVPLLAACGDDGGDVEQSKPAASSNSGAEQVAADLAPEIGTIDNWYNGSATSLSELRGSPVLLVFWADY